MTLIWIFKYLQPAQWYWYRVVSRLLACRFDYSDLYFPLITWYLFFFRILIKVNDSHSGDIRQLFLLQTFLWKVLTVLEKVLYWLHTWKKTKSNLGFRALNKQAPIGHGSDWMPSKCLLDCLLACLPACLLASLPACLLAWLPVCLLASPPARLLVCLLAWALSFM